MDGFPSCLLRQSSVSVVELRSGRPVCVCVSGAEVLSVVSAEGALP